jgi:hypothetical protein
MRPAPVTVTTWLMAILNVLGYATMADPVRRPADLAVRFIFVTVFVLVGYVVLWFYWRGRNWARWLVMLSCLLCFWNLRGLGHRSLVVQAMIEAEALLSAFLLYWLNTAAARTFFARPRPEASAAPLA